MAWCSHCSQHRPIQRQTINGNCAYCGRAKTNAHQTNCRGPVPGALDVCTFCNTPVFAKALTEPAYQAALGLESQIKKSTCFVVTATLNDVEHPIVRQMQTFRDECLSSTRLGRRFVAWYYKRGPALARAIEHRSIRRVVCLGLVILPAYLMAMPILTISRAFRASRRH